MGGDPTGRLVGCRRVDYGGHAWEHEIETSVLLKAEGTTPWGGLVQPDSLGAGHRPFPESQDRLSIPLCVVIQARQGGEVGLPALLAHPAAFMGWVDPPPPQALGRRARPRLRRSPSCAATPPTAPLSEPRSMPFCSFWSSGGNVPLF